MSFILSILRGITKLRQIKKKVGNLRKLSKKEIIKTIRSSVITFCVSALLIITLICGAFYSVTYAVSDLYNKVHHFWEDIWHGGSEEPPADFYNKLTDEQKKELKETGASLDVSKMEKYMKVEADSVESAKTGTKVTVINDGLMENRENVAIDISQYANRYKLNWEFICAVDLAIFEADDVNKTKAIDNASSLKPVFSWNENVSRDTTDTWRAWTEVKETDPTTGVTTTTYNDEPSAQAHFTTVKQPLAIPSKVSTLFGDYIYTVNNDVVIKDAPYCTAYVTKDDVSYRQEFDKFVDDTSNPQYRPKNVSLVQSVHLSKGKWEKDNVYEVPDGMDSNLDKYNKDKIYVYKKTEGNYYIFSDISSVSTDNFKLSTSTFSLDEAKKTAFRFDSVITKQVFNGYAQKPVYKQIRIDTYSMQQTKQKIVEDQVANVKQNFDPTRFIKYINSCGLNVKDLDLVRECLINIPNGNIIVDNIDRIINGDYGDINVGSQDAIPGNAEIRGAIPLFLQGDSRWCNIPYSDNTIGRAGCGVTSMSMVVCGLGGSIDNVKEYDTNKDGILTPDEVAAYATKNGHSTHGEGTAKSLYADLGGKMGLKVTNTKNPSEVYDALKLGKVAIASMTPGDFTRGSHLLVLTGVPLEGMVSINDPASQERSKNWDWNTVKVQTDDFWIIENQNYLTETFTITSYFGATFSDTGLSKDEILMEGNGKLETSTGLYVGNKDLRDRICAVDPSVIPYHSKVYITFSDNPVFKMPTDGFDVPLTGYYTAEDTGGAFQGGRKKIDLYAGTYGNSPEYKKIANQIGTRSATVRYRKK